MHPRHPSIEKNLSVVASFEKVAAIVDPEFRPDVLRKLAEVSNAAFEYVLGSVGAERREAEVVDLVLSMREAKLAAGVKTAAATSELVIGAVTKLASAVYLDGFLTELLPSLCGETKEAALRARLLGREYAVELMRCLVL